jgi:hypothetical protein
LVYIIRHVETETLIRLFGFGGSQDPHDRGVFFHAQGFPADVPPRFSDPGMAQRRGAFAPAAKKGLAFGRFPGSRTGIL